jgi:hypothetical protein
MVETSGRGLLVSRAVRPISLEEILFREEEEKGL